jgi:hypothetical protein
MFRRLSPVASRTERLKVRWIVELIPVSVVRLDVVDVRCQLPLFGVQLECCHVAVSEALLAQSAVASED